MRIKTQHSKTKETRQAPYYQGGLPEQFSAFRAASGKLQAGYPQGNRNSDDGGVDMSDDIWIPFKDLCTR